MIDSLVQNLRQSIRELSSHRAVASLSLLCLSLAIGTNTTVFTFVNALVLRPLPLPAPDRLLLIREARREDPGSAGPVSYPNFLDWQERVSETAELAAQRAVNLRVSDGGATERHAGALVSANFFASLGVQPLIGRGFRPDENIPGAAPVVLVSHFLWQQRYAADPGLVGRAILVNGTSRTVIGIMPAELSHFALQRALRGARLWVPIGSVEPHGRRDERRLTVFARLRDHATPETARTRLISVAQILEEIHPQENDGWTVAVEGVRFGFSSTTRAMMLTAMGAVSFVLLIACANIANLALARTVNRRREIATHLALGASRGRIVRQLVTERLIVSLASIPLGIVIAYWGTGLLLGRGASPELAASVSIDGRVLAFNTGLAVLASVLAGLLPAVHAVRGVKYDVLKGGAQDAASGPSHTRLSQALIVAEVALAMILLVGASLFIQTFRNMLRAEGGLDTSRILAMRVEIAGNETDFSERDSRRIADLLERLLALPGVTGAAAANLLPMQDGGVRASIVPESGPAGSAGPSTVLLGSVTAGFFEALNVPIVRGRPFMDEEDRSRAEVAVVNTRMAQRLWPGENPIGRRFRLAAADDRRSFTVVGVSQGFLTWNLSDRVQPAAYVPYLHNPDREPRLFVRTSSDPALVAHSARAAIHAFDPGLPITGMRSMTEVQREALSRQQTLASLFAVLGGIALLLAATGVYGVLSYFVSQRKYEIGIRAALGADRATLVRLFVRQGMAMTLAGTALGLAGAWALARVMHGRLYGVTPADPGSFAGAACVLVAAGLLAAYVPARRAAGVDPLIAIRE